MSPEALQRAPESANTRAADMWSFGICLWELNTREVPFAELSPMEAGMKVALEGLRVQIPPGISRNMFRLMNICLNEDQDDFEILAKLNLSLTAHGINQEWKRDKYVLAIRELQGSHTADVINTAIREILEEWEIKQEVCHVIVRDGAANMKKAFEEKTMRFRYSTWAMFLEMLLARGARVNTTNMDDD
uniref:Protein kinase domain-containing protein n=1 Tax=Ditylenchus dipsaci TaxID=166011 RepID=A0A915EQ07_9BILA